MYYDNDFSINEICDILNITKNGVYNSLKQTEKKLKNYEQKLGICEKYKYNCDLLKNAAVSKEIINKIK